MSDKIGRNDPCPCGSGKKYKNCHMQKSQPTSAPKPLSARKITAKVLSGPSKETQQAAQEQEMKAAVNYSTLMDRAFGPGIHTPSDKPPLPTSPTEFLVDEK
jgi:uncharacterized protein